MRNSSKKMVGDANDVKNRLIQKKYMNITCESMMGILNVQNAKKNFEINPVWIFISSFVEKVTTKLISKNTSVTNVEKSLVRNRNSNFIWVSGILSPIFVTKIDVAWVFARGFIVSAKSYPILSVRSRQRSSWLRV